MPIQAVDDRRLYRQIADQLTMLITSGEFRRGERLPSERDLAVQLGVSRPSVREALIALEIQGLVEVRVGAGIFVAQAERPPTVPINEGQGPFELLRAHLGRVSADFAQGWEKLKGQQKTAGTGTRRAVRAIRAPGASR